MAGVIAGAGDCKPGIVLDKQQSDSNRQPIALIGKVFCKADAQYGAIKVGEGFRLDSSGYQYVESVPGHRIEAGEALSMLGKTLWPLKEGRGLISMLIALQ